MGRDFRKELDNLDLIYESAMNADIENIVKFFLNNRNHPLLCVGSGGSFSVAKVFEYMCTKAGWLAKSVTPLELTQYEKQIQKMSCVLFSAGGRNVDSRNAYQFLADLEPKGILTCCMRADAPIKKLQKQNLHNFYYEYEMPVKKDGYLAVESLVSSIVLLARAFEETVGSHFFSLHKTFNTPVRDFENEMLASALEKETLIVLHAGITTPVAVDMESKFSEVALGNIQLVDFRNFAHGRHFWLSQRCNSTAIIALVGETEKKLANKTLTLLPESIPVIRKDVDDSSMNGMIEAFRFMFSIVLYAGKLIGINPGKPHVSEFGKKLYHLNHNICNVDTLKGIRKDYLKAALYRKIGMSENADADIYLEYSRMCSDIIRQQVFKGIIFDYDGTLHDKNRISEEEQLIFDRINALLASGIKIGIASGRGKSVRTDLQKMIHKEFWDDVVIAYYNGGCIGLLSDDEQPNKRAISVSAEFRHVFEYIQAHRMDEAIRIDGIEDRNPYQWTIINDGSQKETVFMEQLEEYIRQERQLKLVESSHSIDIVPCTSSKNNILAYFEKQGFKESEFIKIGDAGAAGGNDYELLNDRYGLSVDAVSNSFESCWNYAPIGTRNLEATLFYLKKIDIIHEVGFVLRW